MDNIQLCSNCIGQAITLVLVANGAPILISKLLGCRFNLPIDLRYAMRDGSFLFGYTKTWRGLVSAVAGSMIAAPLLGLSVFTGALFGLLVIIGDLISSFIKRRLGLLESTPIRSLDVLPEVLLPLLVLQADFRLNWLDIIVVIVLFFLVEVFLSPVLFRLHIRNRPY
jgi:CDP-2,3-bis-(O-geranylgeranyl)-sn-glycerol synthase